MQNNIYVIPKIIAFYQPTIKLNYLEGLIDTEVCIRFTYLQLNRTPFERTTSRNKKTFEATHERRGLNCNAQQWLQL